jgi:hypothetical protein
MVQESGQDFMYSKSVEKHKGLREEQCTVMELEWV